MVSHREELERNPRIGMVYKNWDKQDTQLQDDTLIRAQWVLDNIESL